MCDKHAECASSKCGSGCRFQVKERWRVLKRDEGDMGRWIERDRQKKPGSHTTFSLHFLCDYNARDPAKRLLLENISFKRGHVRDWWNRIFSSVDKTQGSKINSRWKGEGQSLCCLRHTHTHTGSSTHQGGDQRGRIPCPAAASDLEN